MKDRIMSEVAVVCRKRLLTDTKTMSYLRDERHLADETIVRFELGLFPQDLRTLFADISAKDLREAGVIRNATSSTFKTWNLIMPIRDVRGKVVALAGRTLLSSEKRDKRGIPKYMNTVYAKTNHLFGLHQAKRAILKSGTVYVVEGYFDVMAAHQAGIGNVVACCGTAFSKRQMALLARYAKNVILLFDNDSAGQGSAKLHVERKRCDEVNLSSVNPFPPDTKDVDDFLASRSAADLARLMKQEDGYADVEPIW